MSLHFKVGTSPTLGIRGIIATNNIKNGEIIEKCPVIIYSNRFDKKIAETPMGKYDFEWDKKRDCIVLGYGSLYNHSYEPNANYEHDKKNSVMLFKAVKDIKSGEEITVNYNGDPKDKTPIEEKYFGFDK